MGAPPSNSGDSITQRRSQRVMLRGPGARHRQEADFRRNANRHCERTRRDDSSDGKSVGRAIAHASELKKWRRGAVSSGLRQPPSGGTQRNEITSAIREKTGTRLLTQTGVQPCCSRFLVFPERIQSIHLASGRPILLREALPFRCLAPLPSKRGCREGLS